jgi:very-short-patch-repair endonuclease
MTKTNNPSKTKQTRRNLRADMTEPEQKMWHMLRARRLEGFKFRRQHGIGPYIVDFFCPSLKLVVEIDGDSHFSPDAEQYDRKRTEYLKSCGMDVIRFTNLEVRLNPEAVVEDIYRHMLETQAHAFSSSLTSP